MKIKVPPSKDPMHTSLQSLPPAPQQATLDSRLHRRVLDTPSKSGSVSCGVTAPFSWVLVHTSFCLYPPRVYFLVLCKFWQLYGGFNGNLLQEGLCNTQVCCTQSPCPSGSPLLTQTFTGDAQTEFCLSLFGLPGSWCAQGLFEPPEYLWWEWGLILNRNSTLLPSCWGFSFVPGHGVSPHSLSSAVQPPLQCLPSCWGFSDLGCGISAHGHSCEAQMLLLTLDVGYLFMATPAEPLLQRLQPLL